MSRAYRSVQNRARSKEAETYKLFKGQATKVLCILAIFNSYNFQIGIVDRLNHLTVLNSRLCHVKREAWQALEYWLLCTALANLTDLELQAIFEEAIRTEKETAQEPQDNQWSVRENKEQNATVE